VQVCFADAPPAGSTRDASGRAGELSRSSVGGGEVRGRRLGAEETSGRDRRWNLLIENAVTVADILTPIISTPSCQ
jgi:hypothetical protein